jgi:hypothetical protein
VIVPDWPSPPQVRACATTRDGGVSLARYASLNLGAHVGDDPAHVQANRERLKRQAALPAEPCWLNQVHGIAVARAGADPAPPTADASLTDHPGRVCAVLTADCLPVLFCNRAGTHVAAAHAGWRGLAAGVLEATVAALGADGVPAQELLVWLGPAIGPAAYEVGGEVRDAILAGDPGAGPTLQPTRPGHWHLDLYGAARRRLRRAGLTMISGGGLCTAGDSRFYSHRRDGITGRQATLVWLEPAG